MGIAVEEQRRRNVRMALWLGLVALAFFFGFIAMSVVRGS